MKMLHGFVVARALCASWAADARAPRYYSPYAQTQPSSQPNESQLNEDRTYKTKDGDGPFACTHQGREGAGRSNGAVPRRQLWL
jgi:hypothetical protein